MDLMESLRESKEYIESKLDGRKPEIGLVLGSGLGDMADAIGNPVVIDYHEIPHFPVSTVPGHKGRLVIGELEGRTVLCMQGRFHYYEGYSMDEVVYPVRVMKMLGIDNLFLTNAAGCVNESWKPGDLMLISDHIKIVAENILKTRKKLNEILAANTGRSLEEIERDTERDNYMSAAEAKEYGLIDAILSHH